MSSQIINTKFITFNHNFYCNDIFIKDNQLKTSQFISSFSSLLESLEIQMNNIIIRKNFVQNFSLFVTEQKQPTSQVTYLLQNLYFEDNILSCNQQQFLITINCHSIVIQNIFLRNTTNFRFIQLEVVPYIRIQNVMYENLIQEQKVQISYNCFKNCFSLSQLLQVSGFKNITLNKITIKNQFSIDQSIISIQSNPLIMQNLNEYILIRNVEFIGNILIKQLLGIFFSLIEVYSEKPQFIKTDNLKFEQNIFHQLNKDPSETLTSLVYVNSAQSLMMMNNTFSVNNSLTNSSQSFFSLFSFVILIENFKVQNHNYINKEFWIQYYEINLEDEYQQQLLNLLFLMENLIILELQAANFFILTHKVMEQQLQKIVIFLMFKIHQFQKFKMMVHLQLMAKIVYYKLILKILLYQMFKISYHHPFFQYILHLHKIILNKKIQFLKIVTHLLIKQQILKLIFRMHKQIKIIQNEQAFLTFLQSLGKINLIEMQKVISHNVIMKFSGCELIINSKLITLMNCRFNNILTFYPLHILDIQQNNIQQSSINLNSIIIENINDFTFNKKDQKYLEYYHIELKFSQCNLKINDVSQKFSKQEFVYTFFDDIYTNSNQNRSLIKLISETNQTRVYFSKVLLLNNNCKSCWNGLLFFELTDFQQFRISELSCINNFIKDYGCIWAKARIKIDRRILIDHSTFISNSGRLGSGIVVQNLRVMLQNSKIINNTASYRGGGFYFEEGTDRFTNKSTIIINNSADEAGGIFLYGNSSLSQNNFIQSLLLFNFAKLSANNINELPTHLSLSINQIEMQQQEKIIQNRSYQVLKLNPFNIISQDQQIKTNFLFIPSGEQILNFQLFNPQLIKYLSYITEFSIQFKNSMNEQQINFINSTCDVKSDVFDIQSQNLIESESITVSTISFNQQNKNFNLGLLQFNIDPYNQKYNIQEILIYCKTEYQEESLAYRMRVKSFLCQLGEFYVFSGFQKCQSEQGFYSVTYNTTKCSLFDKNKFEAITSNNIQLKAGFWRSSYITDNVELCYKNPSHCLGGWVVGDDLCFIGHIGGLCEECDRYNLRGDGQFFKNQQQLDCQQCDQLSKRLIAFFLISIQAIFSTLLTIRSIEKTNQLYVQLKLNQNQKFAEILFKLQQDHESILLKLFLNYFWIC